MTTSAPVLVGDLPDLTRRVDVLLADVAERAILAAVPDWAFILSEAVPFLRLSRPTLRIPRDSAGARAWCEQKRAEYAARRAELVAAGAETRRRNGTRTGQHEQAQARVRERLAAVDLAPQRVARRARTAADLARMDRMRHDGATWEQVARECGGSADACERWYRRHGGARQQRRGERGVRSGDGSVRNG